jgi:hypothetical protein
MQQAPANLISARRGRAGEAPGLHRRGILSVPTVKSRVPRSESLSPSGRAGVRGRVVAVATDSLRGVAAAMIVSWPQS